LQLPEKKSQSLHSLTEVTPVSATNVRHEIKNRCSEYYKKKLVCSPEIGPKHSTKLGPDPARLTTLKWTSDHCIKCVGEI